MSKKLDKKAKNVAAIKKAESKPELTEVLAYAKRNEQQMCDMLPDNVIITRRLKEWSKQQEQRRARLAASEKMIKARENDATLKNNQFRVDMKELRYKEQQLDKKLYGEEELRKEIAKSILNTVKQTLMDKNVKSGEAQNFNMAVSKKWEAVEVACGVRKPVDEEATETVQG